MGLLGTSNSALASQMNQNSDKNFKAMNNLLTLQDNHVEEFLLYHGEAFFTSYEKLLEDVIERVMSRMLTKLHFKLEATQGDITLEKGCLAEYERITEENIQLDIQQILASSINQEVVYQRQMAKNQYLEAQGFGDGQAGGQPQMQNNVPANIQGAPITGGMNQNMAMGQGAMTNQSGYPVPPSGYDNYNNPYWIDPATGQATYTPPNSGLGLSKLVQKGAAWAKWLA
ncbi:MAG: hypothetical protein GOVbin1782_95 [Prokaryotic dsDNA virus sp.]|nr:MAG: hypothetical protein GOVbin1782_95 [Prokaryotic dsDNA virus sp.]|tara:strand:+ start:3426 stop:4109 length:684 start_codon:yes stop_codon:yes gene_type:complete